jgi:hypothetical protein
MFDDALKQLNNLSTELCAFGYITPNGLYPDHLDNYKMFKRAMQIYNDLHDQIFNDE